MNPITPALDAARGIRREVERTQLRARKGIKLLARKPPPGVCPTPKYEVWSLGKAKLWRFRNDEVRLGPPVLLFLGLMGDSAIFDLHPGNSWAERLLAEGFDVFLFDWGRPEAAEGDHDLATYLDGYFVHAVDAVCRVARSTEVSLGAYCMGSLMAVLALGVDPTSRLATWCCSHLRATTSTRRRSWSATATVKCGPRMPSTS